LKEVENFVLNRADAGPKLRFDPANRLIYFLPKIRQAAPTVSLISRETTLEYEGSSKTQSAWFKWGD
jgi:hypothetical protein